MLDEPSTGLDKYSEDKLISSLKKIKGKMIIIIVSHKKEIFNICDRILRLDTNGLKTNLDFKIYIKYKYIMSSEKTKKISVLIVSNCTWYLYNFRKELISQLSDQGYYLILVSPLDNYYCRLKKYFHSKENLFLNRGSENPFLEIITMVNLLFIYIKYRPDLVHHFTIKPCLYGGTIARLLGIKNIINHITGLGPSFFSKRIKLKYINKIIKPLYKYAFNRKYNIVNIFHNDSDRNTFYPEI